MTKLVSSSFGAISVLMMAFIFNAMSIETVKSGDPLKAIMKQGWSDINNYRNDLQKSDLSQKKLQAKAKKDLVGKTVRFNGYIKLLKPHFAKDFDYYLTKELEIDCLPIIKSEEYCGKDNPDYFRVIFNGSGASKRDMDIMLKPNKNKYIKQKGDMEVNTLDDGNYEVNTFNKSYNLQAKIKNVHFNCLTKDCNENALTIHIDEWKFTKLP